MLLHRLLNSTSSTEATAALLMVIKLEQSLAFKLYPVAFAADMFISRELENP